MSAIIGILLAVLAVWVLIKVAVFIVKVLAVLVLIGLAIGAWVLIQRKLNGRR